MSKISTETDISTVRQNWNISSRNKSNGLYALALIDIINEDQTSAEELFKGSNEFIFDLNPNALSLEEPASVQVVPTQDGGQFIEHQGSIYKNITIAGTTGLRPNKESLGITAGLRNPFIDTATQLPAGEKSGFERLLELRNLFRRYFDHKRNPNFAHKTVMVWQNGKEGEYYVVEPITFRTKRSSSSPVTTEYEIQLRTIKRLDLLLFDRSIDDRVTLSSTEKTSAFFAKQSRTLGSALIEARNLVDAAVTTGQATVNNILAPARTLFNGLTGIVASGSRVLNIPRNSVSLLALSALELSEELKKTQAALKTYKQQGIITPVLLAAKAYKDIFRSATDLHAQTRIFSTPTSGKFSDRSSAYDNPVSGTPLTGGNPTDLNNVSVPSGTAVATVTSFDTVFSLAFRLLGDQARWKEIVIVNNLKAPYIDPSGDGKDVLRPGDSILFPAAPGFSKSSVEEDLTAQDDPITTRLGRDLKLTSFDSAGGLTDLDLSVNNRGDIALVEGLDNMAQAVEIKFSTERGTLPTHPQFGIAAPIGSKGTIRSLIGFQIDARASLLSDSRISDINRLEFKLSGNILNVRADIQIAEINEGVALSFDARR